MKKGFSGWANRAVWLSLLVVSLGGCFDGSSSSSSSSDNQVALVFVGHGEPAVFEDGDIPFGQPEGQALRPLARDLGIPADFEYSEWAAAYDEIATAMTYVFQDLNGNGIPHEMAISPEGDVPPFFTWEAFYQDIKARYYAFGNYSPHNDRLREHVESLNIQVEGVEIETFMAYLDAVPRIPRAIAELNQDNRFKKFVFVPMLVADSTHTKEVDDQIHEIADLIEGADVVVSEPFFEIPYMRARLRDAVVAMAQHVRADLPADIPDDKIAVLLASHGTPYVPPHSEFGWQEGEIYSNLIPTEDAFHEAVAQALPWQTHTGRMNYSSPSIEDTLATLDTAGIEHVMVIPSVFPTAAMHTMWDVADKVVGRSLMPEDGVVSHMRESGITVHYTSQGFADIEAGSREYRDGLSFVARMAILQLIAEAEHNEAVSDADDSDDASGGDNNGGGNDNDDGTGSAGGSGGDDNDGEDGNGAGAGGGSNDSDNTCLAGELCVTVTSGADIGSEISLMLYEATEDEWPQQFITLPTPTWVVTERPVPQSYPMRIRIRLTDNLFSFSGDPLDGARIGLAMVTGVSSNFVVDPNEPRGFSDATMVYTATESLDFGTIALQPSAGDICELNPYHPKCLTGGMFWQEHFLGEENFVPGAVYMAMADIDGDGTDDLITVGEPHFEFPMLPLTTLKLGIYYLNKDLTVKSQEIIDSWTEEDPALYSPWGVNVVDHAGSPMIIVGTNIPELAPLEEGNGNVYSYKKVAGEWQRSTVRDNPDPTNVNYNAMIVVTCDIDQDGDDDLAMSGAFGSSSVGSWMENTGDPANPWFPHLVAPEDGTDPFIRGTLAYKCTDLNGDDYPEVVYNGMFDIPNTNPPLYRGEIWLGINPGPSGWATHWSKVVIDDDNWASADMWFHDFDGDTRPDLIANQIFNSTVTRYANPGGDLTSPWTQEVIIDDLTSPSDMWLDDVDKDGLMDVVSADHVAHRGVWHKNPGATGEWISNLIFEDIRLPGDFAMQDLDEDGDLDWMGISMTEGRAYIVEQISPETSLVLNLSLPDSFSGNIRQLMVTLATDLPVTGVPAAVLATIDNVDSDGDTLLDVDQIFSTDKDLVLGIENVGVTGDYHVVVTLYIEGGGQFQPVAGIDYMAASASQTLGSGQAEVTLELAPVAGGPP